MSFVRTSAEIYIASHVYLCPVVHDEYWSVFLYLVDVDCIRLTPGQMF